MVNRVNPPGRRWLSLQNLARVAAVRALDVRRRPLAPPGEGAIVLDERAIVAQDRTVADEPLELVARGDECLGDVLESPESALPQRLPRPRRVETARCLVEIQDDRVAAANGQVGRQPERHVWEDAEVGTQ